MKRTIYGLMLLVFIFSLHSCEEENYKDMNITQHEQATNAKKFTGNLTSQIVVKDINGNTISNIDMGGTFFVIDNTEGGATSREWTITQGKTTIASKDQLVRLSFPKPGMVTISLTSVRASDGKSVTSESNVEINKIPVTASMSSDPADEGGIVNIEQGDQVAFSGFVEGSPTMFKWVLEGPETLTSTEQSPTFTFTKEGDYNLKFVAMRDDGDAGITQDSVVKEGFVHVKKLVVDLNLAIATDNKIELQFDHPIAQNISDNALGEFSIKINTTAGATLTPDLLSISATSDTTVELAFADKMYSDDVLLLTFAPTGLFKDATGLVTPEAFTDEHCAYGHNLFNAEFYSFETDPTDWVSLGVGEVGVTDEKAYNGKHSIKVVSKDGEQWVGATATGALANANLDPGTDYIISWKIWRDPSSSDNVLGPWLAWSSSQQQFWTGLNGLPTGEWVTISYNTQSKPNVPNGPTWFWFRVKDNNLLYIDDISIVVPNPRP